MNIKRGDIYIYDCGDDAGMVQSGKRPVLVIQTNSLNETSPTVIVAAITTSLKKLYFPSHIILPENTGLAETSMVLLEQIRTVNRNELTQYIGCMNDPITWKRINSGIRKTLGFWHDRGERTGDIRCLCSKCLTDYRNTPGYIVRRLDPFCSEKARCEKCDGMGYDYLVYEVKHK